MASGFVFSLILLINICHSEINETDLFFWGVKHVTIDEEVKLMEPLGYANAKWSIPHSSSSRFYIGSNTKLFATVAIYQMDENGLINISDSISNYLNVTDLMAFNYDFSSQPLGIDNNTYCPRLLGSTECENITFIDLLAMNSGILQIFDCPYYDDPNDFVYQQYCWDLCNEAFSPYPGSIIDSIKTFINSPLKFKPGIYIQNDGSVTDMDYANMNFVLIQYFIEKYSGLLFGDYIKEYITNPLGLHDTYFDPMDSTLNIHKNVADGSLIHSDEFYAAHGEVSPDKRGGGKVSRCHDFDMGRIGASGGMVSTNKNMHTWYKALFNKTEGYKPVIFKSMDTMRKILEPFTLISTTVYWSQGVFVEYSTDYDYNNDSMRSWPEVITYTGDTFCSQTGIQMKFIDNNEKMLIVSAFGNAPYLLFNTEYTIGLNKDLLNSNVIRINDTDYGVCQYATMKPYLIKYRNFGHFSPIHGRGGAVARMMLTQNWSSSDPETTVIPSYSPTSDPTSNQFNTSLSFPYDSVFTTTNDIGDEGGNEISDTEKTWMIIGIVFICLFGIALIVIIVLAVLMMNKPKKGKYNDSSGQEMGGYQHASTVGDSD